MRESEGSVGGDTPSVARSEIDERQELFVMNVFYQYIGAAIRWDGSLEEVEDKKREVADGLTELFVQLRAKYPK